jgi:hypothetical protein
MPVPVDDGNACTMDSCDKFSGVIHTPVQVDDGNACTMDSCDPAFGVSHIPMKCDDQNACTVDSCDSNFGCSYAPAVVDDGNACTVDSCASDIGVTHTPVSCDDGNPCTTDSCDPVNGCQNIPNPNCGGPTWWASGVQQNVPPFVMTGWTQCFSGTYEKDLTQSLPAIMQLCSKANLMLTCRQVGSPTWALAAMAPRVDVLFDCGSNASCTHQANGVGWYFSPSFSWGFANGGDPVARSQCDTDAGPLRLCWHTINGSGGYRCGDATGLNGASNWERGVFQAD